MRLRIVTATTLAVSITSSALALFSSPAFALSNARNGCINQWLFNGVWRAKTVKVEPIMNGSQQSGWQVTQTWRNGTARELAPADSLILPEHLQLASGTSIEAEGHRQEALAFNTQAPSGEFTYTQTFIGNNGTVDPNDKPKSLDVSFDGVKLASMSNKPHFTSNQYNFHYDLGCSATGVAAQAQGGSTQLAASEGCMNQWMSNGVWKMRVLAVGPYPPDVKKPADQIGWRVTQEWVNITNGKVYPGALPDVGNRVAPTNVSDEFLATKNGNNGSSFNTAGGFALGGRNVPFAPNVPYTFSQLISWGSIDPADTPIRLLVTFDTAKQSAVKLPFAVSQYRKPANFRISLACGGTVTMAPGVNASASAEPAAAAAQPSTAPQVAAAQTSAPAKGAVDPCAMLSTNDVASALGVGVTTIGTARRASANECSWAVASHAGAPAQTVVLTTQAVDTAKTACHGLSCINAVQSVLGPAHAALPSQINDAFTDAQLVSGLGDKAAWKDGRLTVVKADLAFQLFVRGSASPALATSESLARDVLVHLP